MDLYLQLSDPLLQLGDGGLLLCVLVAKSCQSQVFLLNLPVHEIVFAFECENFISIFLSLLSFTLTVTDRLGVSLCLSLHGSYHL